LQYYCIVNGEYRFSQNDGYDPETGEKLWPVTKEVIQKMKEKEVAADNYAEKPVQVQSDTTGKSPAGIYEKKYLVRVKNELKRGIFFCFTEGHNTLGSKAAILIPAEEETSVILSEGVHQIAFMDTEFNSYGHRKGGYILGSGINDTLNEKLCLHIGGQRRIAELYFPLQVLAMDKQIVTLREDGLITHNQEVSGEENNVTGFSILIGAGILFFLLGIIIAIDKKNSYDTTDGALSLSFILGGIAAIIIGIVNV